MNFGLAIIANNSREKSDLIAKFEIDMKLHFQNKDYGLGIKSFVIGLVCVEPQFERFFPIKKSKYTKGKRVIKCDGIPFTLEDSFEYSIKINPTEFIIASEIDSQKLIAQGISESMNIFDTMKRKIKDFDSLSFKKDIEIYFKEKGLL